MSLALDIQYWRGKTNSRIYYEKKCTALSNFQMDKTQRFEIEYIFFHLDCCYIDDQCGVLVSKGNWPKLAIL